MSAQLAAGLAPPFKGVGAGATPEGWRCGCAPVPAQR